MLKIKYNSKADEYLKIDSFWLRDHCRCNKCYNELTKQRRYNLLDIPKDIKTADINYLNDGKLLKVTWNDGHVSQYDMDFICLMQVENNKLSNHFQTTTKTKWNLPIILQNERHLHVKLTNLVAKESYVKDLVASLIRYGLVFIDEVPTNTTMTEMAIRRVFPVMKTFFGEMYTFSDAPDHADTAYTKEFIGSHTDNTYFCDAAGLQALHCLEHDGTGGENFFVDGLHCALELKRRNQEAFEILTKVHVPAEYIEDGQHHIHSAPIIRLDPNTDEILQLRLNLYDRAAFNTLPQHKMFEFYDSLRQFLDIIHSSGNQWRLKLQPGTIVIFDNWRIFHGRHAYTGHRAMTGCYVQRTDYLSKARVLGIID